jgi:hypothetical protein
MNRCVATERRSADSLSTYCREHAIRRPTNSRHGHRAAGCSARTCRGRRKARRCWSDNSTPGRPRAEGCLDRDRAVLAPASPPRSALSRCRCGQPGAVMGRPDPRRRLGGSPSGRSRSAHGRVARLGGCHGALRPAAPRHLRETLTTRERIDGVSRIDGSTPGVRRRGRATLRPRSIEEQPRTGRDARL